MRLVVLLCGLFFLTPFALAEEVEVADEELPEVIYMPLTPQFTVNLLGDNHYLRTTIQLELANNETKDSIEANDPAIRHKLIVLLSNNQVEDISSSSGKMELQDRAVKALNKTLKKYTKKEGVDAVFFTEFVSQ